MCHDGLGSSAESTIKSTTMPDEGARTSPEKPFADHLRDVVQRIRGTILELLTSAGADPSRPQDIARTLGLKTKLAWQLSRVVTSKDEPVAVDHLPGGQGIEILLAAGERAGAAPATIDRVRKAVDDFARFVEIHAGDRATLDLMLLPSGAVAHEHAERLESLRKMAFLGNSATWGIQARARVSISFFAPNADAPDRVDSVGISGVLDLRRLRSDVRCPLFDRRSYRDDGSPVVSRAEPVFPSQKTGTPMLIDAFCSQPFTELSVNDVPNGVVYELAEGPVGNRGAVTYVVGSVNRAVGSCYRTDMDRYGETSVSHTLPAQDFVCDVYMHEDLPRDRDQLPEVTLHSQVGIGLAYGLGARSHGMLPIAETLQDLGQPPIVATPVFSQHGELVDATLDQLGWDLGKFRGYRLVMHYPPIATRSAIRYELPERP